MSGTPTKRSFSTACCTTGVASCTSRSLGAPVEKSAKPRSLVKSEDCLHLCDAQAQPSRFCAASPRIPRGIRRISQDSRQIDAFLAQLQRASQAATVMVAAMIRYPIIVGIGGLRVPFTDAAASRAL